MCNQNVNDKRKGAQSRSGKVRWPSLTSALQSTGTDDG